MRSIVLACLGALLLVSAGCVGPAPDGGTTPTAPNSPTATAPGSESPTSTAAPTDNVSVAYTVSAGEIPQEFRSVNLTVQAVFVEAQQDFTENRCWRETYDGPYKPTPTPIGRPNAECHRSDPVTVNLTALDEPRSLGNVTAPGRFSAGHALLVTNVSAVDRNGTAVEAIRGAGGHPATVVPERPAGSVHVELGVGAADEPRSGENRYWLVSSSDVE